MFKRILTLSLALVMLMGTLMIMSCSKGNDGDGEATTAAGGEGGGSVSTIDPSSTDTSEILDVPESVDYGNKDFVVMGFNWSRSEFAEEKAKPDIVDEALVTRDNYLESYIGINLIVQQKDGQFQQRTTWTNEVSNSIKASDGAYDLILTYSLIPPEMMMQGLLLDMRATPEGSVNHLNFDKAWWPDFMVDLTTVNNKTYFISGDASTNLLYNLQLLMFNSTLMNNYNITEAEIYEMVDSGVWTLETFLTMTAGISEDNGDGIWDSNDFYALSPTSTVPYDSFYFGTGNKLLEYKDGVLQVSDDILSEKAMECFALTYGAVYTDRTIRNANQPENKCFKNGKALFQLGTIYDIHSITTETDISLGILPFPKYEADGETDYAALVGSPHGQFCIPIDTNNFEISTAVLETMGYANYTMVSPIIFENMMKVRYSKDLNSSRMFDYVRAGATTDLGILFYDSFGNSKPQSILRNCLEKDITNWVSNYKEKYEADMKKVAVELNSFYMQ